MSKTVIKKRRFYLQVAAIWSFSLLVFVISFCSCNKGNRNYTRPPGIYPGRSSEDFSPEMIRDNADNRNLAFHRPAYSSGSYDYNLTAQLVTDGIIEHDLPGWISTSTSQQGILVRNEREWLIDHNPVTSVQIDSTSGWVQIDLLGNSLSPEIDRVVLDGNLLLKEGVQRGWSVKVLGSDDGRSWQELGTLNGSGSLGDTLTGFMRYFMPENYRTFSLTIPLRHPEPEKSYRMVFNSTGVKYWQIGGFDFFRNDRTVEVAPSHNFKSAWMSNGRSPEWIYVDLGDTCKFKKVIMSWIGSAPDGKLQVSDDALTWKDLLAFQAGENTETTYTFENPVAGRYVRILLASPEGGGYKFLSEFQVFGTGGVNAQPKPMAGLMKGGDKLNLDGGNWRIQRASLVQKKGETLSGQNYNDSSWNVATVPATVLMSYKNIGAIPDPNFSDNQLMVSESYFYSDFWYRTSFNVPNSFIKEKTFLNFDGINWKADVFLNGSKIGRINGAFTRGIFDVTNQIIPGKENILAVRILKNDHPGVIKEQTRLSPDKNGGVLGADNPTFHATIGWDWIPTIRGRDIGIWNDVYLTSTGIVTLSDPYITSDLDLPDTSYADLSLEVTVENHSMDKVYGALKGTIGDIFFEQQVPLAAGEKKILKLDPSTNKELRIRHPHLWWPAGYGPQNLYPVKLTFVTSEGSVSDVKNFEIGIREMNYSEKDDKLKIWINGKRFIGRGGNWGFSESNLSYRKREYEAAVRYHKDMHFTMIRNWVGQTGDDEFFDACDKYGIMIWEDFWLANPVDGPNPFDPEMFLNNADDFIKRIRNHPAIGLYCGRNEGNPPPVIEKGLRKLISELQPEIHYISNSAFGVVSGGGPYRSLPPRAYFGGWGTTKFHSEKGMPNIVNYESLELMMPDSDFWPINRIWGIHDFCLEGAQGGSSFIEQIRNNFGKQDNVKDWISMAQWINYSGYRAMFEASGEKRMGLLLWMSHPAWPSMVWQTYDYYLAPTAGYFGAKKANEPIHIQWNPNSDSVEIVNYSSLKGAGLTAEAELYNMDGTLKWGKSMDIDCPIDSTAMIFKMEYPDHLTDVQFIKLRLSSGEKLLSDNFYWHALPEKDIKLAGRSFYYHELIESNYQALNKMPKVKINFNTDVTRVADKWYLRTQLRNPSDHPALMIRLKVAGKKSGNRILPVLYSDNYISLMPGEQKQVKMEFDNEDTRGEKPEVVISGFNLE